MKIKITTNDFSVKFTIDSEEAHKAYYLYTHPEKRGIFSNGVAISGKDIRSILPDFNATMGWNPTHPLDDDDWNEIRKKGVKKEADLILENASNIARLIDGNPALLEMPLSEGIKLFPENKTQKALSEEVKKLADKFKLNDP